MTRFFDPRAALAACALLLLAPSSRGDEAVAAMPLASFPRESIAVETRSARRYLFDAWRAESPAQRE